MSAFARGVVAMLLALAASSIAVASATEDALYDEAIERALGHSGAGRYAEAHATYEECDALAERFDRADWLARTHRERGVTFLHQNAWEDARASFQASADAFDALGDVEGSARARLRMASMTGASRPLEGMAIVDEIIAELREADLPDVARMAELYRARMLVISGDLENGLELLRELRAWFESTKNGKRLADVLNLEAWTLQQLDRLPEARQSYLDLVDTAFSIGRHQLVTYAYCNLGDVEHAIGSSKVAEAHLDRAIESLDRMRSQVPGGVEERLTFLDAQVSAYDGKIAMLVDRREVEAAFDLAERFHGTSFLEALHGSVPVDSREALDDEARSVLSELVDLQQELIETGLDESRLDELRELERRWEKGARERRRRAASAAPEVSRSSVDDIRRRLPAASALIAYWVHPERIFAWVVRPDRLELVQIPVGREELRGLIDRYLEPIRDRVRAEDQALRGGAAEHLELGATLYRLLIEPAASMLEGIDHLILVPDDRLWHLPFEALVRDVGVEANAADGADGELTWFADYARARYVAHDWSTIYAPSASAWIELAGRQAADSGLLAVAPSLDGTDEARERGWSLAPLPAARREAVRVASLIRPGDTLLGRDASESSVRARLGERRYLHFATHGYLHDARPQLSGLFLWPDDDDQGRSVEDGLLQGFEVRGLSLRAELVSLAACNSGLGQLSRAEGLVGVARSFLLAGARNALVSLWPVDDRASGALIEAFYGRVGARSPLPSALRDARLATIERTIRDTVVTGDERISLAHPYFWATYVLIGGDTMAVPPAIER